MHFLTHWGLLALLASLLLSIVNVLDQVILYHYKLAPWIYFALDGVVGLVYVVIILVGFEAPLSFPVQAVILSLISGVALAAFNILYFHALQLSDLVVVVILMQTTPVFSLIWGTMFMHEVYNKWNYGGMLLVLLGACIAAVSGTGGEIALGRRAYSKNAIHASFLMLGATFSLSIAYLVNDIAVQNASAMLVFFWQRLCLVVISLLIMLTHKQDFQMLSFTPVALTSVVETLVALALFFLMVAFSAGPMAAVSFLSSIQPVWIVLLVWILNSVGLQDYHSSESVPQLDVLVACVLVISGIYLINLA